MSGLLQDLRLAARVLARSPGFTAVVVIALGLGLGVSTAVFNTVSRFLMHPLAIDRPEEVVRVLAAPQGKKREGIGWVSYPELQAVTRAGAPFSGVVGAVFETFAISNGEARRPRSGETPELVNGELVSGNFFETLGVSPTLGRGFTAEEGSNPGAAMVVVISDSLWRRRFGADPGVLGRRLYLNQNAVTIVGVMPATFKGVVIQSRMEYWCPLIGRVQLYGGDDGMFGDRQRRTLSVLGRLDKEVTPAQANERLSVLAQQLAHEFPDSNANMEMYVVPEIEGRYGRYYESVRLACGLALGITCLVLLIACANVANLLLARATVRTKDIGVRLALGAGRGRIARQLLTESLLLAALGGGFGLLLALWFGDLMHAFVPPRGFRFELGFVADGRTAVWVVVTTLAAGLLCGLLPAARAARTDVLSALKTDVGGEGHRLGRGGLRQSLVIAQLATSVVVVVCAGLFARSLGNLHTIDMGFHPENLVSGNLDPTLVADYSDERLLGAYHDLKQRLAALPGVTAVSSTRFMPLGDWLMAGPVFKEGDPPPPTNQGRTSPYSIVDEHYFQTVGTDLVLGRDFTAREHDGPLSTAVINQQLARQLFGSEQAALGRRFRAGAPDSPLLEIIGVVRDGRYRNLFEDPTPWIFFPSLPPDQKAIDLTLRTILIRGAGPQALRAIVDGFRAEVANLDARIPITEVSIGAEHLSWAMYIPRLAAQLGLLLALLALALAAMGIYSLMTYTVSQRTKEIGIRIALGGRVRDVLKLIMGQALALVMVGVVVGTVAALVVSRFLTAFLYDVGSADPLTVAGTVAVLVLVALLATLLPARRAARVDPMVALRYE